MRKQVVLIGESELMIECAKLLLKYEFTITHIHSPTISVKKWADSLSIPITQDINKFYDDIQKQHIDYLFSIQNRYIIPSYILKHIKQFAINYHNSLLPRYGGNENNASWMIWNNEQYGGITWHIVNDVIDGGAILKQSRFTISSQETAVSLLLKCQDYAISAFKGLLIDIRSDNIHKLQQSIDERLYFHAYDRPCGFAVIDYNDTAETICRKFRALNIGTQKSPITTLKFKQNNVYYAIKKVEILNHKTTNVDDGTIVKIINTNQFQITTKSNDVYLTYQPLSFGISVALITAGSAIEQESYNLSPYATQIAKAEIYWIKEFAKFSSSRNFIQRSSELYEEFINIQTIAYNEFTTTSLNTFTNQIQTLMIGYLYKINDYEAFSVCVSGGRYIQTPEIGLSNLFLPVKPLNLDFNNKLQFESMHNAVNKMFIDLEMRLVCSQDLLTRYPDYNESIRSNSLVLYHGSIKDLKSTHYPIVINIDDSSQTVNILIAKSYSKETPFFLNFIKDHLIKLYNTWITNNQPLFDIVLLSNKELEYLDKWNNTKVSYPEHQSLGELIDDICNKYPENIALESNQQKITYSSLKIITDTVAKNISSYLQKNKKKTCTIGLFLDKSVDTIITMIATLKAGCCYTVIDRQYPDEYINHIIKSNIINIFIYNSNIDEQSVSFLKDTHHLKLNLKDLFTDNTITILPKAVVSDSSAYVIFTSGSTGTPKGVKIKHNAVVNLAYAAIKHLNLTTSDKVLQFATLVFDACVGDIYATLLTGATLYIPNKNEIIPGNDLQNTILDKHISCVLLTPSVLKIQPFFYSKHLRVITVAGEECSKSIVTTWGEHYILLNAYGPTECTVFVSITAPLTSKDIDNITIGKPIQNCKIVIYDKYYKPNVIGAVGEITISGSGLANGYIDTDATKLKFKQLNKNDYSKSYLSGDLGKWNSNGEIKYIGRKTSQIKIRGFRVELSAIEHALSEHPEIKTCGVLLNTEQDSLNTYIVPRNTNTILTINNLREFLSNKLPNFYMPNKFFIINELPFTTSDKLDYKALMMDSSLTLLENDVINLPQTQTQKEIATIWQEILKIDAVDVCSDFSEFGGTSLQIIQMISKVQKKFNTNIPIPDFLSSPTIKHLEGIISNKQIEYNDLELALQDITDFKSIKLPNPETKHLSKIKKVLLTGITGFLGAYLAKDFMYNGIEVFCLIRGNQLNLPTDLYNMLLNYGWNPHDISKLNIIYGDISLKNFGLEELRYAKLCGEIDLICNSAAFVNHIYSYKQLRGTNVYGVINCIKFALTNKAKKFVHISTISVLDGIKVSVNQESLIDESDLSLARVNGYSNSKLVAEICISHAVKNNMLQAKIYRPSWISGDSISGKFTYKKNHLFLLIKECLQLGYAPDVNTQINFVPVDYMSKFIVLDSLYSNEWSNTYNIITNDTISLKNMITYFAHKTKTKIDFIRYEDWQNKIRDIDEIDSCDVVYLILPLYLTNKMPIMAYSTNIKLCKINDQFLSTCNRLDLITLKPIANLLPIYTEFLFISGFLNINTKKQNIIESIELVAPYLPAPIYWKDKNGVYLGVNKLTLKACGFNSSIDMIGKTDYDLWPQFAVKIRDNDKHVMETEQTLFIEEAVIQPDKTIKYFAVIKIPLYNERGDTVGIIGNSVDITDTKEKKRLELENKVYQIEKQQQEELRLIVNQVVHDIKSPVSTLRMILPHCDVLPEDIRLTIKKSLGRVQDVAGSLLSRFKPHLNEVATTEHKRSSTLISVDILEIIAEKKYEYAKFSVDFVVAISKPSYFAFIDINAREFKRMISNLINNAIDAFDGKSGVVTVKLDIVDNKMQVVIKDNGKGMPDSVKEKILNNIAVTSNKKDGHGIGFEQIRDTLAANEGKLAIESKVGNGTTIILTFPIAEIPNWICNKIELRTDDFVVILDDDPSIHGAWKARFKKDAIKIKCKHFEIGKEAIEFINNLSEVQKDKVFLLTDYELLKQGIHGLDVINNTNIKRSILVTSHHNDDGVHVLARLSNTKILPKLLASEVVINQLNGSDTVKTKKVDNKNLKKVDLVIIDDDDMLVDMLVRYVLQGKKVDTYCSALEFLRCVSIYSKNTKFLIDNQFKNEKINGIKLAIKLHRLGFCQLYLFSGWDFTNDNSIPHFLNIIAKTDTDTVKNLVDSK